MKIDPKNDVLWRAFLVYFIVVAVGIWAIFAIVNIQVKEKDELLEIASKRELKIRDEKAHRGNVISKNGTLLATSVPRYSIYFDPVSVKSELFDKEVTQLADSLSRLLKNKSKQQYVSYLKDARAKKRRYVKIANKISVADYKRMQKFPIFREGQNKGGFISERSYVRELPYGELAARTIGYVREEEGIFVGLEGAYNENLKGSDGRQLVRRINGNFWMPMPSEENVEPVNGDDIYTSIDIEIQLSPNNANRLTFTVSKDADSFMFPVPIYSFGIVGDSASFTGVVKYTVHSNNERPADFKTAFTLYNLN
jgi:cell division protein FtsI (penicillin-binding protein 3)